MVLWRLNRTNSSSLHVIVNAEEIPLGRRDLSSAFHYVSRKQCTVQVASNGQATVTSCGRAPTGWKQDGAEWQWLKTGSSRELSHGDMIALDRKNVDDSILHVSCEGPIPAPAVAAPAPAIAAPAPAGGLSERSISMSADADLPALLVAWRETERRRMQAAATDDEGGDDEEEEGPVIPATAAQVAAATDAAKAAEAAAQAAAKAFAQAAAQTAAQAKADAAAKGAKDKATQEALRQLQSQMKEQGEELKRHLARVTSGSSGGDRSSAGTIVGAVTSATSAISTHVHRAVAPSGGLAELEARIAFDEEEKIKTLKRKAAMAAAELEFEQEAAALERRKQLAMLRAREGL